MVLTLFIIFLSVCIFCSYGGIEHKCYRCERCRRQEYKSAGKMKVIDGAVYKKTEKHETANISKRTVFFHSWNVILSTYKNFPKNSLRICGIRFKKEKFRPQSARLYIISDPEESNAIMVL